MQVKIRQNGKIRDGSKTRTPGAGFSGAPSIPILGLPFLLNHTVYIVKGTMYQE